MEEIPAYECCNDVPTVLTDTIPGEFPLTYVSVRIFCDESTAETVYTTEGAATMEELIAFLIVAQSLGHSGNICCT